MSETQEYTPTIIKAEELDPKFKYKLSKMPGAEKLMLCFQCGTCTADCPISRFSDFYRPRKIARMVQLGLKDRLLSDDALWLCSTCFTCVDHCPQGVEIAGIVRVLRNLTVREKGVMPIVFKELASNILRTGYVYQIPESRHKRREMQGLPTLPKPNLEDVKKMFRITGSSGILETVQTFDKVKS
ncbi:MAG: 4Fe-4S dicluster domain-containing protein [Candidatus Bathyarchaeota archaeon]|nr:4Fe-4S dicluster domain-containing protein [Candidatus Bathyarchaeota archaeon]MDH5746768.1 4Fe-4S dicluster domain-containing protein [Candidatus Bathyarchaeota archaeon]